jgi:S-adenosyl-L-methionine hydrolase (adenosine-forming)
MNQTASSRTRPVVALLTDFGLRDGYVGVMKGVIVAITSDVQIIDITHDIAPQNIASGAWTLATSYRYFPRQTVFICVVDPGVGSSRQAIAVHAGDWFFVGPDNGLFSYVQAEQSVHAAVVLSNPLYHLTQISGTFHGRDIFAPAGAYLARGVVMSDLGIQIDPATLQRIDIIPPVRQGTRIDAYIVHVDHFGNLISNIPLSLVPELFSRSPVEQQIQIIFPTLGTVVERRSRFFADALDDGQPFIYGDSSGYVGIAVRNGSAARTIGAGSGTPIVYVT